MCIMCAPRRYGQQVVPITRDDEDAMAYGTERGIWVSYKA